MKNAEAAPDTLRRLTKLAIDQGHTKYAPNYLLILGATDVVPMQTRFRLGEWLASNAARTSHLGMDLPDSCGYRIASELIQRPSSLKLT